MSAAAIRLAGPCEVALLAELAHHCFESDDPAAFAGTPWSARSLAEVMALPGVYALLAVEAGDGEEAPAGFLLAQVLFEAAELLTLGVLPARRRAGIGRALLQAALAEARGRGAQRMTLEVAADNRGAQTLYRAAGFAAVGRRRNYYLRTDGTRLDAVILACDLGASRGGPEAHAPGR